MLRLSPGRQEQIAAVRSRANHEPTRGADWSGGQYSRLAPVMTEEQRGKLRETLKRLGYGRNKQIRLYGENYDLTSDPIVVADQVVLVDGIERRSQRPRRIRLPLTILNIAKQKVAA